MRVYVTVEKNEKLVETHQVICPVKLLKEILRAGADALPVPCAPPVAVLSGVPPPPHVVHNVVEEAQRLFRK